MLRDLVSESVNYVDVILKSGRRSAGGNLSVLKKKIDMWDIYISHFETKAERMRVQFASMLFQMMNGL